MLIPESVRLVYCYFGNGIALGVYGTKENVDIVLDGLYNYEGHNDEATRYLSDNFGYILTTKDKLLRGLSNAFCTKLIAERVHLHRGARVGVWSEAQAKAAEVFATISHEPFLTGSSPAKIYEMAS
jgi:hypothetical protein